MTIRPLVEQDLQALRVLWESHPGIRLRAADRPEALAAYLALHPGLSFVAEEDGQVIGGVIAGHDGRRGNLQHLVVAPGLRLKGIGRELVRHAVEALAERGVLKSHIYIQLHNDGAEAFWRACGWFLRDDIKMFSFVHGNDPEA
jgi:ribosomal protein S18 acetylase RimI-like enzyme